MCHLTIGPVIVDDLHQAVTVSVHVVLGEAVKPTKGVAKLLIYPEGFCVGARCHEKPHGVEVIDLEFVEAGVATSGVTVAVHFLVANNYFRAR